MTYTSISPTQPVKTPLGIKLLCILFIIGGGWILYNAVLLLLAGEGNNIVLGVGYLVFCLIIFGIVYGLWLLQTWAWALGMLALILDMSLRLLEANAYGVFTSMVLLVYLASKYAHFETGVPRLIRSRLGRL